MRLLRTAMDHLGLPLQALLLAIPSRVQPHAIHGAEFLLLRGDWAKRLDALQHRWWQRALGLDKLVARRLLMVELAVGWRLSTVVLLRALCLLARIEICPSQHTCYRVYLVAKEHQFTWWA